MNSIPQKLVAYLRAVDQFGEDSPEVSRFLDLNGNDPGFTSQVAAALYASKLLEEDRELVESEVTPAFIR